jgi:lipoprotein-anchoring transpeptidase ErfK/SrfK
MFRHVRLTAGGLLLMLAVAACSGGSPAARPAPSGSQPAASSTAPASPSSTAPATPVPTAFTGPMAADVVVPEIALHASPGGAVVKKLTNPTPEQMPLVLLVTDRNGDWLQVQAPMRPNDNRSWISAADVTVRPTPYKIEVALAAHRLTVRRGAATVLEAPVAIGTPDNPTPTGSFYIDAAVSPDPNGPYGARELSVAGFSDTIKSGAGGGQIAIHGTNAPTLIGQNASHGCVRMLNADVIKLHELVPVGTPVEISA